MDIETFVLLKVKKDDKTNILKYVEESYRTETERHYYALGETDKDAAKELSKIKEFKVLVIIFNESESEMEEKKRDAYELYIGDGKIDNKKHNKLNYKIYGKIDSKLIIDNYINKSWIDLNDDFEKNSYLSIHGSNTFIDELSITLSEYYNVKAVESRVYGKLNSEKELNELSQKNHYCRRAIGLNEPSEDRSEFQRDRERIVHSKSSRRLVDKAQIFTSSKGDHFRTRMTHTLEVSQIARGLSLRLNLNHDLTEAIALAHDIGHTPFGHQGERTLKNILSYKIDAIKKNDVKIKFGGFKHNFQGIRVLTHLEEKYLEHEGLDLSYQVLEGVFKHTGGKKTNCSDCKAGSCSYECNDIDEFLILGDKNYLFMEHDFPTTLEGQIVKIADEIAQRGHDLDDAFASNHLDFEELLKYSSIKKMTPIKNILEKCNNSMKKLKEDGRMFIDDKDILRSRIVPEIIGYFISDVTSESKELMKNYNKNDKFFIENNRVDKELIKFSNEGNFILNYLEKIISNKVINSSEVSRFDDKAQMIITSLFRAYYDNPKLLPNGVLKHIYIDFLKNKLQVIDFTTGNSNLIREEFNKISHGDLSKMGAEKKEYIEKRKILVRNITDYISSMTDKYATNEYSSICESK